MAKGMADMMVETAEKLLDGEVPLKTGEVVAKVGNIHQLERKRDHDAHDRGLNDENLKGFQKICKQSTKKKR